MRLPWRAWASLGVAALAGVSAYLIYVDATAALPVVVASRDLKAPVKVEPGMVTVALLPAAAVHSQALASPHQVVGKVLRRDVVAGEPFLRADVAPGGEGGLSLALEEGQQAFFVPTRLEQGLGGAVEAGDRVDVIFVGGEGPGAVSRTLLEGVPVLQVRDEEGRRQSDGRPLGVLLGVTPVQAEQLAYALTYGRLYLSLAPATEWAGGGTGVTWDNLFVPDSSSGERAEDASPMPPSGPGADGGSGGPADGAGTSDGIGSAPESGPGTGAGPATSTGGAATGDAAGSSQPGSAPPGVPLVHPDWVGGEGEQP